MATVKDILVQHIISDVELCYFETFSANTDTGKFNLVLLYKEHGKHQFIEGISEVKPEDMKEELRACNRNIKFAEGLPLNWSQLMKEVRESPQQFSDAGGWDCLTARNTELVIKMEPGVLLSCCSCEEKVPSDHEDIEQRKYIFYCSNCRQSASLPRDSQRGEKSVADSVEDSEEDCSNKTESEVEKIPNSREVSGSSRQPGSQEILSNSEERSQQSAGEGPPAKKSRMELTETDQTEGEEASLSGGSGGQPTSTPPASPRFEAMKAVLLQKERQDQPSLGEVGENNNIQDPLLQEGNKRREDKEGSNGDPGCDQTLPVPQPPTQRRRRKLSKLNKLELVKHASQCQEAAECAERKCRKMKELLAHIRELKQLHIAGNCKVCSAMMRLLADHASLCQEAQCAVPECQSLKQQTNK